MLRKLLAVLVLLAPFAWGQPYYATSNATKLQGKKIQGGLTVTGGCVITWNTGAAEFRCSSGGTGDVTGPASSTNNQMVLFSGATGKAIIAATITGIPFLTGGILGTAGSADYVAPATEQSNSLRYCSSSTGSDTYTCSLTPALTAYTAGMVLDFVATATANTGAASVNVNSLGAKNIVRSDGSTAPSDGDITIGRQVRLVYDGTSFRLPVSSDGTGIQKGNGTGGFITTTAGTDYSVPTATVNAQTGTTYTLVAGDNGKVVTLSNASAITLTVPASLGAGFNCLIVQLGAGQVTVAASGTTINQRNSYTKLSGQYAVGTLTAYVANTFVFGGDLQ